MFELIILLMAAPLALFGKTIYFVPYPGANPKQMFYNLHANHDEYLKKWILLRESLEEDGFTVKFTNDGKDLSDFTCLISITNANPSLIEYLKHYPKDRCWFINLEPPVYLPHLYDPSLAKVFGKIFVMFDDLIDNDHYYKFYYPQPRNKRMLSVTDFSEKKFCVMIAGNKKSNHPNELYSERKKVLSFFSNLMTDELDLYGHGWKGYENWKGSIGSKWNTIEKYKFCICYENMKNQVGYITEKIFDCFVAGCIPIYWGADNIQDYIPKECFIDRRDFSSYEDLYLFLKSMDRITYQNYLKAIDRYLESPKAELYSIDHFIAIIKKHLKDLGAASDF